MWHDRNIGVGLVTQSSGWSKLWKIDLPHKIKLFLWRFCRNNVPVKTRLSAKGVCIRLDCPMCNWDVEDLNHVFFLLALLLWPAGSKQDEIGFYKLNVDAAIKLGDPSFSMGLVLRDHTGAFVTGKTICRAMVSSVVEAEAQAILEGLQWLLTMNYDRVDIESDSLSSVRAIHSPEMNLMEVGIFIDACRLLLDAKVGFSVSIC
ncbi:uncharacterized protein LOC141718788 [Apium graveolens]|uniref:uncharacterized protein LOC141718788 n=1 Tax=Apium graveolens TaxID=4045 RepID=UPI003D7B3A06